MADEPDSKPASGKAGWVVAAIALIFVVMMLGSDDGPSSPRGSSSPPRSSEYMLAAVDSDDVSASNVQRYGRALDAAERACRDSRSRLGDMALRSKEIAAREGVRVTALELLQEVSIAVPTEARPMDCAEIFAAIIVLMTP